jgi:hypothetical protein
MNTHIYITKGRGSNPGTDCIILFIFKRTKHATLQNAPAVVDLLSAGGAWDLAQRPAGTTVLCHYATIDSLGNSQKCGDETLTGVFLKATTLLSEN